MYIYICMYIYVLAIAGPTAGPNWLIFLDGTHGQNLI